MYEEPAQLLSFGDIFEREYFIDVFLRSDASVMGDLPLPAAYRSRLARALNADVEDSDEEIIIYAREFRPRRGRNYVLGRGSVVDQGSLQRAVLLTDDCAIDMALGRQRRGRRIRGRLLFAPISTSNREQITAMRERPVFGRCALPPGDRFDGGLVELGRCFMVDVRDVNDGDRLCSLGAELREDLEAAWSAAAVRRGPLVAQRNCQKLAQALAGSGGIADQHAIDASLVADALGAAWRAEGGPLARAAAAVDQDNLADAPINELISDLRLLAEFGQRAADSLQRYQERLSGSGGRAAGAEQQT